MKKYAFIRNNIVILVNEMEESEYSNHILHWDAILDITDLVNQPAPGWKLEGNILVPVSPEIQQQEQQIFGQALSLELINRMGARNLALSSQGISVNVAALLTNVGAVKSLLETGALKTARSIMILYLPNYSAYSDIFEHGINRITSFLVQKGWDG